MLLSREIHKEREGEDDEEIGDGQLEKLLTHVRLPTLRSKRMSKCEYY